MSWLKSKKALIFVVIIVLYIPFYFSKKNSAIRWIESNGGKVVYELGNKFLVQKFKESFTLAKVEKVIFENAHLDDLSKLSVFKHLNELRFYDSSVKDFRIDSKTLKELSLADSQVNNLDTLPALENLEILSLHNINQNSIEFSTPLHKLNNLALSGTLIKEISSLTGFKELSSFTLAHTNVQDLTFLKGTKLQVLHIKGDLENIEAVSTMVSLKELILEDTNVVSLMSLKTLSQLEYLNLSSHNQKVSYITDLSPLSNLEYLYEIDLWGSSVTDLSPLYKMTSLNKVHVGNTDISDEEIQRAKKAMINCNIW